MSIANTASLKALNNDYKELCAAFNPDLLTIRVLPSEDDIMCLLECTVDVSKFENNGLYYLNGRHDTKGKKTNRLTFWVEVYHDYPNTKPRIYYTGTRRNASVNTFLPDNNNRASQCTDDWGTYSSLTSIVRKTLRDILHDPEVARFDSIANSNVSDWQKEMIEKGLFPTIPIALIYRKQAPAAPPTLPGLPAAAPDKTSKVPPLPV